jgi:hypothetical protein
LRKPAGQRSLSGRHAVASNPRITASPSVSSSLAVASNPRSQPSLLGGPLTQLPRSCRLACGGQGAQHTRTTHAFDPFGCRAGGREGRGCRRRSVRACVGRMSRAVHMAQNARTCTAPGDARTCTGLWASPRRAGCSGARDAPRCACAVHVALSRDSVVTGDCRAGKHTYQKYRGFGGAE